MGAPHATELVRRRARRPLTGIENMRKLVLGVGAALALAGAAYADSSVTSDAEKALCAKHGGTVQGSGAAAICVTAAKDAECAKKNAAYGFDYRTGGCGLRSAESGATAGGWQDVQ